jgi:hypothetical protein
MRISPSIAFITIFDHIIAHYLAKEAPQSFLNYSAIPCEKFWWSALLHLQNILNSNEMVKIVFTLVREPKKLNFSLSSVWRQLGTYQSTGK